AENVDESLHHFSEGMGDLSAQAGSPGIDVAIFKGCARNLGIRPVGGSPSTEAHAPASRRCSPRGRAATDQRRVTTEGTEKSRSMSRSLHPFVPPAARGPVITRGVDGWVACPRPRGHGDPQGRAIDTRGGMPTSAWAWSAHRSLRPAPGLTRDADPRAAKR